MDSVRTQMIKTKDKNQRRNLQREFKTLRKEVRMRENKVVKTILDGSDVIFSTTVGAASRVLKEQSFDIVIIDEAAQALEASCWIPILKVSLA